jgi:hypothetical protein
MNTINLDNIKLDGDLVKLKLLNIGISPILVNFLDIPSADRAQPFILSFKLELKGKKPMLIKCNIYKDNNNIFLDTIDGIKAQYIPSGRLVKFSPEDIKFLKADINVLLPQIKDLINSLV